MAYLEQGAGRQRACVAGAVVALHGVAIWALISGLAVTYIKEVTTVIVGRNIPIEPVPPTPPPPTDHRKADKPAPRPFATRPVVDPVGPVDKVQLGPVSPLPPGGGLDLLPQPEPRPLALSPPRLARPVNDPARWLTDNDYPTADIRAGHEGVARVRLSVGSDGRVNGCEIAVSTGFAGLDAATCTNVSRRARFAPARDESGAAVSGTYTGTIRWVIPKD